MENIEKVLKVAKNNGLSYYFIRSNGFIQGMDEMAPNIPIKKC